MLRRPHHKAINLVVCFVLAACVSAGKLDLSKAPLDQPFTCGPEARGRLMDLMWPYVEHARNTYPQAKARWQSGLPPGHTFYLTTTFDHGENHIEQVFVKVAAIDHGRVRGVIATAPRGPGYKRGQPYAFDEAMILDWTIQRPDGSEEGNFVGNFLDRYRGKCPG